VSAAPRLVVFDLGGVVVRICRSWAEGCAQAGVEHRPEVERALAEPAALELLDRHQRGGIDPAEFFERQSRVLGGGVHAPAELERVHRAWILGDYPGIGEAIDRIHAAGLDTACLSNTNAAHWEQLQESDAFRRIRTRHASHLLGLAKPDHAIYRAFERAVGRAPDEVLLFDDLPENVEAARACGWPAVRIDHRADTAAQVLAALRERGIHA
jgi:FMN phosphatase YigB (HAD superfamily)